MEKHIPHMITGIIHSFAFIAAVFGLKPKEKIEYLGDNFPHGVYKIDSEKK